MAADWPGNASSARRSAPALRDREAAAPIPAEAMGGTTARPSRSRPEYRAFLLTGPSSFFVFHLTLWQLGSVSRGFGPHPLISRCAYRQEPTCRLSLRERRSP